MSEQYVIGTQGTRVRFEQPDLAIAEFRGETTPDEMGAAMDHLRRFSTGKPYVLTIIDMREMTRLSAETRQRAGETGKDLPVRGTAILGASMQMRMIATLVTKALNLFNRTSERESPLRFFSTEQEARAWLVERRTALLRDRV